MRPITMHQKQHARYTFSKADFLWKLAGILGLAIIVSILIGAC